MILCTGGFGGNAKLCEEMFGYPIKLHGMYQNDGVMLLSAINDLGAGTYSMDSAGMAHTGRTAATLRLDNVVPSHNKVLSSMANNADLLCENALPTREAASRLPKPTGKPAANTTTPLLTRNTWTM